MSQIRVMLVDDQSIVLDALRELIEAEPAMEVVAEAADGESAVAIACSMLPDVIVMDIRMPRLNGIEATRQIMARGHRINVIAFSAEDDPITRRAMQAAGAAAYLTKDASFETLRRTIRALGARPGRSGLETVCAGGDGATRVRGRASWRAANTLVKARTGSFR